jgi:hypothetical protein
MAKESNYLPVTLFRFTKGTLDITPVDEIRYGGRVPVRMLAPRVIGSRKASVIIVTAAMSLLVGVPSRADLDNQVFTSRAQGIRLTVPKGWRASDLASYPGVVLWMLRSQPPGWIIVGAEPLRQQLVCSWPPECRTLSQPLAVRYACALRLQLERQNVLVGPVQAGPKENIAAGLPSIWFEFTDGKRFVRQALAVNERRAVSLVLSTTSVADRATHARAFDQALRSLRELADDAAAPATAANAPSGDAPAGAAVPTAAPATAPGPTVAPATAAASAAAPAGPRVADVGAGPTSPSSELSTQILALPLFDPDRPCP